MIYALMKNYLQRTVFVSLLIYTFFFLNLNSVFCWEIDTSRSIEEKSYFEVISDDIIYSAQDFAFIGKNTIDLSSEDLIITAGVIGTTVFTMAFDKSIRNSFANVDCKIPNHIFNFTNHFGSLTSATVFSSGTYLAGLFLENNDIRITGRLIIESLVVSGLITQVLKISIGRSRPYLNEGNTQFNLFETEDKYFSLPSGHSTISFAIATVYSQQIDTWWAYAATYSFASVTSFARIYKDKHWVSDIVLGAIIGTLGGTLAVESEKNREQKSQDITKGKFSVIPTVNGVSFYYSF